MLTLHTPTHFNTDHHHHHHHLSRSSSSSDNDISFSNEIGTHRDSSVSDYLSDVDLESGGLEGKVHLGSAGGGGNNKPQRDCRICHLGLESYGQENGVATELGCSCKGDLGAAHKKCAETWFKIKGDMICEICGNTALNVAGKSANEAHNVVLAVTAAPAAPVIMVEARTFWHSRRYEFLACLHGLCICHFLALPF